MLAFTSLAFPWLLMVFDDEPVAKEVKNIGIIVDNSLVHVLRLVILHLNVCLLFIHFP